MHTPDQEAVTFANLKAACRFLSTTRTEDAVKARQLLISALHSSFEAPVLGFDIDGTVDESAQFFGLLTMIWPGRAIAITGREDATKAMAYLRELGIRCDEVFTVKNYADKAKIIAEQKVKVFFEDMDEVITHISDDVTVLKIRNGGNFDAGDRKWLYSEKTGRPV